MVLVYHTIGVLREVFQHIKTRMMKEVNSEGTVDNIELDTIKSPHQQPLLCSSSELREPLLDDQ